MGLLDWLAPKPAPDPATLARIEHTVAAVEPLIRQVGGYEHILAPAVEQAYRYCEDLALAIPGPFPISRAAFATDPLVHALFGSAEDIASMLATSQCVRDYLTDPATDTACYALLGMRRKVTAGFGTRISGNVIRHDEPQKVLTFGDHTLAEPSHDLDQAHRQLAERMFDGLLKSFVTHVDEVRGERRELSDAAAMERAWARSIGPEAHTRRLTELQERLRNTADALEPRHLVHTLAAHLAIPETSLSLDPVQLWVDRFGVIAEGRQGRDQSDVIRFVELTTRDLRRWVVMVVKIDRAEARAAVEHFDERRRYIVI